VCGVCALVLSAATAQAARSWPVPPAAFVAEAHCIHAYEVGLSAYPSAVAWALRWHDKSNPSSRGGMQFEYGTWDGVGGRGDPADASRDEQVWRAYLVWKRDGGSWREWSTARLCGLA